MQAMVRGPSEVVEHEVHVGHGVVLAHQALDALLAERLGRDDVGAHRHHAPVGDGAQSVEIASAREHGEVGAHGAAGGRDAHGIAGEYRGHGRRFADAHASRLGGARQPERVIERVQVAAAGIEQPAAIALRRKQRLDVRALQQTRRPVPVGVGEFLLQFRELAPLPLLRRDVQVAPVQVAVDRVVLDPLPEQRQRFDRHVPHAACVLEADLGNDALLRGAESEYRLSAAPARCAPADPTGLEQHDAVAAGSEIQRGRAAADACANHAHVRTDVALERRPAGDGVRSCGIVRGGVIHAGPL